MSRYREIDLKRVQTIGIAERESKVRISMLAKLLEKGETVSGLLKKMPSLLGSRDFLDLTDALVQAREAGKPVLWMMGAHVIKAGLSPILIQLMDQGIVQGLALNGAGAIHDVEMALFGETSEDVSKTLITGRFGMARETADFLNESAIQGRNGELGLGEALGKRLAENEGSHFEQSILAQAYHRAIPVTVHVALGTDIVHQHASADGAAIGACSLRDFRIWTELIPGIHQGGVVLLFGSAVILPEVFLKSLAVARNVHGPVEDFITANFDMIHHYRPRVNVLERPAGRKGYALTGHHEIMLPLLAAALIDRLA
ncbi:MAG TPA: hypothetical protein ENN03_11245 [bacterium]|nr:hypothetical protein [bacterium]